MDREEEVRLVLVGERRAVVEAEIDVVAAGEHGTHRERLFEPRRELLAISSVSSFSALPAGPSAPVSLPPCPGSMHHGADAAPRGVAPGSAGAADVAAGVC